MKTPEEIQDWLKQLSQSYIGVNVTHEYNKMCEWCKAHHKQPTERRFIAWLNRIDAIPVSKPPTIYGKNYLPPITEIPDHDREVFMQNARAEIAKLKAQFNTR